MDMGPGHDREPLRKRPAELHPVQASSMPSRRARELEGRHEQAPGETFDDVLASLPDEPRRHPMQVTGEPPMAFGRPLPKLPPSGGSMDEMHIERNRDYQADSDLCFRRGQYFERIRFTGQDMHTLRAVLNTQDDLAGVRARAREIGLSGNGHGTELAAKIVQLAETAHADGYRLCDEDHRATNEDAAEVADFLEGLLAARKEAMGPPQATDAHAAMFSEIDALRRVIQMLRDSL